MSAANGAMRWRFRRSGGTVTLGRRSNDTMPPQVESTLWLA